MDIPLIYGLFSLNDETQRDVKEKTDLCEDVVMSGVNEVRGQTWVVVLIGGSSSWWVIMCVVVRDLTIFIMKPENLCLKENAQFRCIPMTTASNIHNPCLLGVTLFLSTSPYGHLNYYIPNEQYRFKLVIGCKTMSALMSIVELKLRRRRLGVRVGHV
jgi:hypothetical protein